MKKQFGFTLVELLIVIALLGALAVGLLASLDPFEQFKKGTDTGIRNTVSELQGAVIRYYAIKNQMPWGSDTSLDPTAQTASLMTDEISNIINAGELKQDFITIAGAQLGKIYVTGTQEKVSVCFMPTSRSFRSDLNTKFSQQGSELSAADVSACSSNVGNDSAFSCYWCVK